MFKPVSSKVNFPKLEKAILQLWKEKDVFHRTEREREGGPLFMLYEGPPTANGSPGIHHVLARVFKDIIPRYKTMKGYRCVRKGGWDTHGLPVELEVEKKLGLKSKREIEEYGVGRFNLYCRESVFRYVSEWQAMTERVAYWVDMEHPYVTLDNDYIETGWWVFRQLWDKGLIYQGMKGTPHCPRCVTSLSSHEVAQGYQENTPDPAVYVKFKVIADLDPSKPEAYAVLFPKEYPNAPPTYFLAWTTTPWTLPGNTALAVAEDADYALVEVDGEKEKERLILATSLVEKLIKQPWEIKAQMKGTQLVRLHYEKLYDPAQFDVEIREFVAHYRPGVGAVPTLEPVQTFVPRVISTDFVSLEEGTGIVHMAPAFGDEDLNVGRKHGLAFVQPVDPQGNVTGTYPFAGKFVKEADEEIMADLQARGLLYRREVYHHTYPFCWRCEAPLLYYAKTSWYIRTTAMKERLVSGNQEINWHPAYIKEGRFGEWLRNNVDWAVSRERYWGTPIPVWRCSRCGTVECVGSVDELMKKTRAFKEKLNAANKIDLKLEFFLNNTLDLHRPYIDHAIYQCPDSDCDGIMTRTPEVMDAWYDSGVMPYAQWHVPVDETVDSLTKKGFFPADYICEAIDQTRGWFYTLHALSTLLTGEPGYRNVICLGLILDEQGRKMSKHLGNVVNPWEVLEAHGADATRWYLFTASAPGDTRRFSQALVGDVVRRFLLTLWNVYSFFITYANIDRFHPGQVSQGWKPSAELDRWLLSEIHSLVAQVDSYLEMYNPTDAGRRIQEFVDLLSNWYVRRSRRRFWKSENDKDKLSAYATLYTALTTLSKLMASFTPFLAEEMYQNLVCSVDQEAQDSVHLAAFPVADSSLIEPLLMEAAHLAMRVSRMGRAARSRAGIKVRQPLSSVLVKLQIGSDRQALEQVKGQIMEELNVKDLVVLNGDEEVCKKAHESGGQETETIVKVGDHWVTLGGGYMVALDTRVTPNLADEGLARELVHRIQNLRKAADFDLTNRIVIYYQGPQRVGWVVERWGQYIRQETLAEELRNERPGDGAYLERQRVDGMDVVLGVRRV